jgi:hypothetical protein
MKLPAILLLLTATAFADPKLPFEAVSILRRMDDSTKRARDGTEVIKFKKQAIDQLAALKKSPLIKPEEMALLDAKMAEINTEIVNDPNLMLGEWSMSMIGYGSTYKFLPGGQVASGSAKGTWKVEKKKLTIQWGQRSTNPTICRSTPRA